MCPCETGHEDFKATDSRDADWLIVRCYEGFDGGLPLTNYELEVYSEENVYHVNTIYLNHTDRSGASGPVFEVPGLEPGRNYRLHLYAVNAKGRSDPVVLEPVTLKGVAMYTTGESLLFRAPFDSPVKLLFRSSIIYIADSGQIIVILVASSTGRSDEHHIYPHQLL